MDFRLIPIKKRPPNKYDTEKTYVIPVRVIKILRSKASGPVVPIIIERLDFFTGQLKKTIAITFLNSIRIFEELDIQVPFKTDGIVFKENGQIKFKVIGAYNSGFVEDFYDLQDNILNNNEKQIQDIYESNYKEIRNWIGNKNSNDSDLKSK